MKNASGLNTLLSKDHHTASGRGIKRLLEITGGHRDIITIPLTFKTHVVPEIEKFIKF